MKEYFQNLFIKRPRVKKVVGALLILIGLVSLVTPFTPGSWLAFIGLEFLGFRILVWEKIKSRLFKD